MKSSVELLELLNKQHVPARLPVNTENGAKDDGLACIDTDMEDSTLPCTAANSENPSAPVPFAHSPVPGCTAQYWWPTACMPPSLPLLAPHTL